MKVLVTGATGFIGSHVLDQLVKQECSVIATARNIDKAKNLSWFSNVKFIPFDLNALSASVNVYELFEKPDVLIHLAWEGLPNYKESFHLERNYPQQCTFIKQMVLGGLRSLTVTGTCLEYGMQMGALKEDAKSDPLVAYAQAKDKLREYILGLQVTSKFSFKWVRLFYTYGSGQSEKSILSQLDKVLEKGEAQFNMSGGQQLRDYMPVEEVAENIVRIALQEKVTGIINCCSAKPVSIEQFVREYLIKKNKNIILNLGFYPYLDYEPMEFWGDNQKLQSILK